MLIISVLALAVNIFAQGLDTAYVPVKANAAATLAIELPDAAQSGAKIVEPSNGTVTVQANTPTTLTLILGNSGNTSIKHGSQIRGDAAITIYSISGVRILNDQNVAPGAYLLLVKNANGKPFTYKIAHSGGRLSASAALAKQAAAPNGWKITAVPTGLGYQATEHIFNPVKGTNSEELITLPHAANLLADWTPTAAVFAIVEKNSTGIANSDVQNMAARNVALSWSLRPNITKYEVYRNGELLGETIGNVMEDYDLTTGQTYEYIVAGYATSNKILSAPVQAAPFAAAAAPGTWRYMNQNSDGGSSETTVTAASGAGSPDGVAGADNRRYDFRVTGDGTLRTFQYRTSANGTSWGNWTDLPSSPGGSSALTVGSWTGNLNGTQTTINPAAYVPSSTIWNGASGQTGVNLEGVHWYRVHDKGLRIGNFQEGKYVLGCHREPSGNYNLAHFMLVSCYPNNGKPYGEITYSGRPFGFESRDQRIFADNDGTAYAMCSALGDSHFFKLDPEWKEPIEHTNHVFKGAYKETPDILRYGDWYFYFGSRQNGWYPSQVQYSMSKNIGGTWSALQDFGNVVTFGAQFNGIRTDSYGDGKTAYGFYSYRWSNQWDGISKENNGNPRRFSILNIHGDYVSSHWFNNIVYYPAHGYVGIRPGRNLSLGKKVTAPSSQKQGNLQAVTDGMETSAAPRYENNATPYDLVIDLEKASVIREITVTTRIVGGSESPCQYTLSGSVNGSSYTQLADASSNGQPGFVIHAINNANAYRYIKLSVSKFNDVRHNNANTVSWADGVYEVAVYGTQP
ncbi:MAG: discoidin domain-containing protein [Fibromonadales bacterium]|nr:discoidin domain-containing protein [Fibromonadales bacterium]